jgi:folate-binding protein YgfZ
VTKSADSIQGQYAALNSGPAWIDRSYRSLIEVTGKDRVAWVHNLTTNQVRNLSCNEGNYAFVLNVQGRILFDLNVVVRAESIWLDLDRRFLQIALSHFKKYIIMEDVHLTDRSGDFVRAAFAGERAKKLLAELGAGHAAAMPAVSTTTITHGRSRIDVMRNDFCGVFAADLFLPHSVGSAFTAEVKGSDHPMPAIEVDDEVVQVRRIEAGIPWPGAEITDDVLAAETRQLERAVSFQKGCYLGQEIVERMRARKVVAKMLSGLKVSGEVVPPPGAEVIADTGAVVGKITSACHSVALNKPIALAYMKTASATPGAGLQVRWGELSAPVVVAPLPFILS